MKTSLALAISLFFLTATYGATAETIAPKRIDGGILMRTIDSARKIIEACVPIYIVVSFYVLEDGTTSDIEVIEATPEGIDPNLLIEMVELFQYSPQMEDGVAVKSDIQRQSTTYDPSKDPNCSQQEPADST